MAYYDKTEIPAQQYFPYLLTQHRSDITKSEAKTQLQKATSDMEADPITTLTKIRDLAKRMDHNPTTYLETCLQESDRFLRMYCGSSAASFIRMAYNQRAIKNFQNYIDAAKDLQETIEEGHLKKHSFKVKKTRNRDEEDDLFHVASLQEPQPQDGPMCQVVAVTKEVTPAPMGNIPLFDSYGLHIGYFNPTPQPLQYGYSQQWYPYPPPDLQQFRSHQHPQMPQVEQPKDKKVQKEEPDQPADG
jgi:hypothetical protein